MGDLTGAKKAAKLQSAATNRAADMQAKADREAAQAAQYSLETATAQDKASREAAALLSTPLDQVDVALGSNLNDGMSVDQATGKRRTVRQQFRFPAKSGINL